MSFAVGVSAEDAGGGPGFRLDNHLATITLATTLVQIASVAATNYSRGQSFWLQVWWAAGLVAFLVQAASFLRVVALQWRRARFPGGGPRIPRRGGRPGEEPPGYTALGIVLILIAMAVGTVCHFALQYVATVATLGTFDALYCSLGTMATVRASLENVADPEVGWQIVAMVQEGWDLVFISGIVALGLAKTAELLRDDY